MLDSNNCLNNKFDVNFKPGEVIKTVQCDIDVDESSCIKPVDSKCKTNSILIVFLNFALIVLLCLYIANSNQYKKKKKCKKRKKCNRCKKCKKRKKRRVKCT